MFAVWNSQKSLLQRYEILFMHILQQVSHQLSYRPRIIYLCYILDMQHISIFYYLSASSFTQKMLHTQGFQAIHRTEPIITSQHATFLELNF